MADAIVKDEELPTDAPNDQVEDLMLIGTSMGGARAKTVVEDEHGLWIAKFNRPDDKWSYVLLDEELRCVCINPQNDAAELFRRMCFNTLISNMNDHPRNHALIAKDKDWNLSPAYDLTPAVPISLERRDLAMSCGDEGRYANASNLLSQSVRFLLEEKEAVKIITEMEKHIGKSWYSTARSAGVSERDCEQISGAFVYPGFRPKTDGAIS